MRGSKYKTRPLKVTVRGSKTTLDNYTVFSYFQLLHAHWCKTCNISKHIMWQYNTLVNAHFREPGPTRSILQTLQVGHGSASQLGFEPLKQMLMFLWLPFKPSYKKRCPEKYTPTYSTGALRSLVIVYLRHLPSFVDEPPVQELPEGLVRFPWHLFADCQDGFWEWTRRSRTRKLPELVQTPSFLEKLTPGPQAQKNDPCLVPTYHVWCRHDPFWHPKPNWKGSIRWPHPCRGARQKELTALLRSFEARGALFRANCWESEK